MLAQLTISNFAIVRELEIDFHSGMTAITGETGAGKSIAIDALGLCLAGVQKATWCALAQTAPISAPAFH
jgi:DNA repair protein RecN (Recombination protein N)